MNINLTSFRVLLFTFSYILTQILSIKAGKYFPYVTLTFFISLFLYLKPKFNKYILFGFFLSMILCIRGFLNGNSYLNILHDFLIFTPILLAFVLDNKFYLNLEKYLIKYLSNSLIFLIPLGVVIYVYMGYSITQVGLSRFNFNEDVKLEYFSPIMSFLYAPFLVYYFSSFNNKQKVLLFAALIFISLMGLITLSRSLILNLFIPFILYFTHYLVTRKKLEKLFIFLTFLSIIGVLLNYFISNNSIFNDLIILLENRNESQIDSGNISSDRYTELDEYLKQNLTILDYIFGRGFGGEKILNQNSSYIGGIAMMHIGAAHVFLKGGLLLFCYLYLPILFIIIYYLKNYNYNISYLLIWFLIADTITTNWSLSYPFLFYSLSISFFFNKINFRI